MSPFQILVVTLSGCLFTGSLIAFAKGWASRRECLVWATIWLTAGIFVMWPELTTVIAKRFGIQRGADLILYCAVITMPIGFLMIYARLRALRRELTVLVRRLAIADATGPGASPLATPSEDNSAHGTE